MVAYREALNLSPEEAAYLAGLIDGEGTITLGRKHKGDNRQLIVSISSTERPILEYVQRISGVGKITGKRIYEPRHAPGYTYCVTNRQALSLLSQVCAYLRSYKSRRCELILQWYLVLTPRNGKYSAELAARRRRFEERILATRPDIS